jgi:hypothetical protein
MAADKIASERHHKTVGGQQKNWKNHQKIFQNSAISLLVGSQNILSGMHTFQ